MSEVAEFYDKFSEKQVSTGINNRHLSILRHLKNAGLHQHSSVLEVGCGVGTVSELILRFLSNQGSLKAVDISPISIQAANKLSEKYSNASFEVRDLTQELLPLKFDTIVLPDVIEHIPFSLYPQFFNNLFGMLKDNGFVFIHIPHPNYLQWLIDTENKELQIIDQPVYTDTFLPTIYSTGFYLHALQSYSVYTEEDDYQLLILKKRSAHRDYEKQGKYYQVPLAQRIFGKLRYIVRGLK
jgi:trans-aconitate 2-methyltransferase